MEQVCECRMIHIAALRQFVDPQGYFGCLDGLRRSLPEFDLILERRNAYLAMDVDAVLIETIMACI